MGDVVIDTDVASVVQKGRSPGWVNRHLAGQRVWLTFVTVAELWKWAEARSWGPSTRDELALWLSHRPVIPSDDDVSKTWARLGHGLSSAVDHVLRTTRGSPPVACAITCRSSPSTRRTSQTSLVTTA